MIGCQSPVPSKPLNIQWSRVDIGTPVEIKVFHGIDTQAPLNIWAAIIDENSPKIQTNIIFSDDLDKRETLSQFVQRTDAILAVNGGYFIMGKTPTSHVGLLKTGGTMIEPAASTIIRWGRRYNVARGAFGIKSNHRFDIAWANTRHDTIFEWAHPIPNKKGRPSAELNFAEASVWDVEEAVHAGPVLIQDSTICITVDEEVFFGTKIPELNPRTAVGYTRDNHLVLVVVDGRQSGSRGASLEEIANVMLKLGCIEALNLDGGGSSGMVVRGELMNRPAGSTVQREVMSAIAVFVND